MCVTHAETCPALKTRKCTQIHDQLLIRADTCTHIHSNFDAGKRTKTHAQPPISTDTVTCTHTCLIQLWAKFWFLIRYNALLNEITVLGKLGTRHLSQTLSNSLGRGCTSISLQKLISFVFLLLFFLLLGKLGTRQYFQKGFWRRNWTIHRRVTQK